MKSPTITMTEAKLQNVFLPSIVFSAALLLLGCDGSLWESQSVPVPRLTLIEVLEEIASDNSRTLSEPDREILLQASDSGTPFNGVVKAIHSRGRAFEFRHYAGGSYGNNSLILWYPNQDHDKWLQFINGSRSGWGNALTHGGWSNGLWDRNIRNSFSVSLLKRSDGLAKVGYGAAVVARFRNDFASFVSRRFRSLGVKVTPSEDDWGREAWKSFPHRILESLEVYLDGRLEVAVGWKPDGERSEASVVDGNGTSVNYYENGQMRSRSPWLNGLENGLCEQWHDNGAKKEEISWKGGKKDGFVRLLWDSSSKMVEEGHFRNGKREGKWRKLGLEEGKRAEGIFSQGKGVWTYWRENGQKWREWHCLDESKHGPCRAWYENGQMGMEGYFEKDRPIGQWTYWHDNGQKAGEGPYEDGFKQGLWVYWDENGNELSRVQHTGRHSVIHPPPPLPMEFLWDAL